MNSNIDYDKLYYISLVLDKGEGKCVEQGCSEIVNKGSSRCAKHVFKAITHRQCPWDSVPEVSNTEIEAIRSIPLNLLNYALFVFFGIVAVGLAALGGGCLGMELGGVGKSAGDLFFGIGLLFGFIIGLGIALRMVEPLFLRDPQIIRAQRSGIVGGVSFLALLPGLFIGMFASQSIFDHLGLGHQKGFIGNIPEFSLLVLICGVVVTVCATTALMLSDAKCKEKAIAACKKTKAAENEKRVGPSI